MINGDNGIAVAGHKLFHDGIHICITVFGQNFLKNRQGAVYVTEVDTLDAVICAKLFHVRHQITKVAATFQPAADAEFYT